MKAIVLGAGYWGKNYVRELAGNLVAVIEPDKERAEYVEQIYNVSVYPDIPEDLQYDAAFIVTPPDLHVKVALPILKSGRKVLIEKPLATSVEEAMALYPYKKQVMAAHIYLYHPAVYHEMKSWIKKFPLDHVFAQRTNHGPIRDWQNVAWDLATHDISICNYLLGKPVSVEASGTRDWVVLSIQYIAASAIIYVSWFGGPKTRRMELVPAIEHERYLFDDSKWIMEVSPLRRMLDAFLEGSWDRCTLDEGIEVLQVLEAVNV